MDLVRGVGLDWIMRTGVPALRSEISKDAINRNADAGSIRDRKTQHDVRVKQVWTTMIVGIIGHGGRPRVALERSTDATGRNGYTKTPQFRAVAPNKRTVITRDLR